jgi:hypothetical protein
MKKAIVLALALMLVFAGVAVAKKKRHATSLTLKNTQSTVYEGVAQSKRPACESRRTVTVFHDENRNGLDGADYRIGSDTTSNNGAYRVVGNQAPPGDTIIALVARRTLPSGAICKGSVVSATALTP